MKNRFEKSSGAKWEESFKLSESPSRDINHYNEDFFSVLTDEDLVALVSTEFFQSNFEKIYQNIDHFNIKARLIFAFCKSLSILKLFNSGHDFSLILKPEFSTSADSKLLLSEPLLDLVSADLNRLLSMKRVPIPNLLISFLDFLNQHDSFFYLNEFFFTLEKAMKLKRLVALVNEDILKNFNLQSVSHLSIEPIHFLSEMIDKSGVSFNDAFLSRLTKINEIKESLDLEGVPIPAQVRMNLLMIDAIDYIVKEKGTPKHVAFFERSSESYAIPKPEERTDKEALWYKAFQQHCKLFDTEADLGLSKEERDQMFWFEYKSYIVEGLHALIKNALKTGDYDHLANEIGYLFGWLKYCFELKYATSIVEELAPFIRALFGSNDEKIPYLEGESGYPPKNEALAYHLISLFKQDVKEVYDYKWSTGMSEDRYGFMTEAKGKEDLVESIVTALSGSTSDLLDKKNEGYTLYELGCGGAFHAEALLTDERCKNLLPLSYYRAIDGAVYAVKNARSRIGSILKKENIQILQGDIFAHLQETANLIETSKIDPSPHFIFSFSTLHYGSREELVEALKNVHRIIRQTRGALFLVIKDAVEQGIDEILLRKTSGSEIRIGYDKRTGIVRSGYGRKALSEILKEASNGDFDSIAKFSMNVPDYDEKSGKNSIFRVVVAESKVNPITTKG